MVRPPPDEPGSRSCLAFPSLAFPLLAFPRLAFPLPAPRLVPLRPSPRRPANGHSDLAGILGISLRLASRALSAGGAPSTGDDLSTASVFSCLTDLRQILRT